LTNQSLLARSFTGVPSFEQHLAASVANEALATRLAKMAEYGWSVTCLFYSALHLTEAYLVQQGRSSANHRQRDLNIIREPNLNQVRRAYARLKAESEHARYECMVFTAQDASRIRQLVYVPMAASLRRILGVH
jgi:hypothetical protein